VFEEIRVLYGALGVSRNCETSRRKDCTTGAQTVEGVEKMRCRAAGLSLFDVANQAQDRKRVSMMPLRSDAHGR